MHRSILPGEPGILAKHSLLQLTPQLNSWCPLRPLIAIQTCPVLHLLTAGGTCLAYDGNINDNDDGSNSSSSSNVLHFYGKHASSIRSQRLLPWAVGWQVVLVDRLG